MKLISHRGNLTGIDPSIENHPDRIDYCIKKLFDVEIDLWSIDGKLYLGHDEPQYEIGMEFLTKRKNNLWIHCKNESALFKIYYFDCNYFWHQNDDFTVTSKQFIWTFPGKQNKYYHNQVILDFQEINREKLDFYISNKVYGVCSDNFNI